MVDFGLQIVDKYLVTDVHIVAILHGLVRADARQEQECSEGDIKPDQYGLVVVEDLSNQVRTVKKAYGQ